ncbi:WD40/YVTN/BNR-like repeat-containing protein [Stigmatella aurantiaca]|uniref:BNR domain protein n=1 Tax=Stigmatella aurantiaca (strain DW4/3-1) TaxID=378806 RepID=E3FWA0_STIAD|nr:neuraminidase [Stigmatella aurantiaca]ADO76006.1 BNR domain protein [Stigmatella aurantiaca DW4/3-1]
MAETSWEKRGSLAEGLRAGAVAASRDGFGLVSAVAEPSAGALQDRMRGRRAHVYRATSHGLERVYEGPGWIQALDCHGALCAALGATLKASGSGSDYHLLVSTDGGRQWVVKGPVPVPSAVQVLGVSTEEFWVLGAYYLGRTLDGGATWEEVELEGERNPHAERIRRTEQGVALLGKGLALTRDGGGTWSRESAGAARLVDVDGAYVVAVDGTQARLGERRGGEVRWLSALPAGREPLRLTAEGAVVRVLTRNADPGKGVEPSVHVSEDGGKTWSVQKHELGPHADIAGPYGLGTDLRGGVFGRVA